MNEIEKLQKMIDESSNIVFFGGAGVSTESGIKDFRGKNGLYNEKNDTGHSPEYLLSIDCLLKEPKLFFDYYRENLNYSDIKPNVTHLYLKKLEDSGKLKAIVTQNIDGLHQLAGSKNVLEVHGNATKCYCMKCYKEYTSDSILKNTDIPKCSCGGTIRPDVTLYGEMLPEAFNIAVKYISEADMLIVAGTSLTVYPAAGLVRLFRGKHLVIINENITPLDYIAELVINKKLGEVFGKLK